MSRCCKRARTVSPSGTSRFSPFRLMVIFFPQNAKSRIQRCGPKGFPEIRYSPSLRRHYPDQVLRVVLCKDSQPERAPPALAIQLKVKYSTAGPKSTVFWLWRSSECGAKRRRNDEFTRREAVGVERQVNLYSDSSHQIPFLDRGAPWGL